MSRPRSVFGVIVDKNGTIECAIGQNTDEILGFPASQLCQKPFIRFGALHDRITICSLLPSSPSYRNKVQKTFKIDFINEKTGKLTNLEVSAKLISFQFSQSNDFGGSHLIGKFLF
uniref:LOV domain-containing protein n=1 Tax=Panagrolaimus sp. PS1159 TaxID=55785 RepID=A0AC35FH30_9BILA